MILLAFIPVIASGILGMVLDFKYHIEGTYLYWMLGGFGATGSFIVYRLLEG